MQRYLINHLGAGEFISLLLIFNTIISLVILFLVRKYLSHLITHENNRYIGFFLGSITATYGFVLGFIIVSLWQNIHQVQSFISQESESLSVLVYNAAAFPASVQHKILSGIDRYIYSLFIYEWPSMRLGHASPITAAALKSLFSITQSYSPNTKVETIFYSQFVANLDLVSQFRGKRLEYLHTGLIDVIRFMLIFGFFLIIFLASLLESKVPTLHALAVVVVSAMLSFNLGLAFLFDYPLSGYIAAAPTSYVRGVLAPFKPVTHEE